MSPQKILHAFHFQIRAITACLLYWNQAETHSLTNPKFKYDPQSYLKNKLWVCSTVSRKHTYLYVQSKTMLKIFKCKKKNVIYTSYMCAAKLFINCSNMNCKLFKSNSYNTFQVIY